MNGCLKCIHKPFCTLSAYGAACSSFKDKDRYADRNEVIKEFAERLKENLDDFFHTDEDATLDTADMIDRLAKEMTEEHDRE